MNQKSLKGIINDYFSEYLKDSNTLAIVITGSYSRNINDMYSDIDWVLIVKKNKIGYSGFKETFENMEFDCRIEEFNNLDKGEWNMSQYFAYLNCKIYFDKNNIFEKLINKKKREWKIYLKKLISIRLVECSVFLRFPKEFSELVVKRTHYEKFSLRRDFYSSYNCLNIIQNQLIDLCYLANCMPIPDDKNKLRNIDEYDFANLLRQCYITSSYKLTSIEDLENIYEIYKNILLEILKSVNHNFDFDNNIKIYYYKYRGEIN